MTPPADSPHDRTMSPRLVNLAGAALVVLFIVAALLVYERLWGRSLLDAVAARFGSVGGLLILAVVLAASILVHELLHLLGYWATGAPRQALKLGFHWRALMPYAHCRAPLRAGAYKLSVALPGLVIGCIPLLLGFVFGSDLLAFYGVFMLASAVGDLFILGLLLPVANAAWVQDHPSLPGFRLLPGKSDASDESMDKLHMVRDD